MLYFSYAKNVQEGRLIMTAALIIASGKTSGRKKFEPEKIIGTISALERITLLFQKAGIRRIVVVCDEDSQVKKLVPCMNLTFLPTPPGGDMLDSIKTGLQYLQGKCENVLISYVDVPMFSVRTIQTLLEAGGELCAPSYHGRHGHPVLLPIKYAAQILAYEGDGGLRGATKACGIERRFIEVDDPGIISDIQRDNSYKKLLATHDVAKLHVTSQFQIGKECSFYDPGVHHLMKLTEELGSLAEACRYVGISYSKGRKIVHTIEEQLGSSVIESQQGGRGGGFSRLTDEAKDIMKCYDAFCEEAEAAVEKLFEKHFATQIEKE